MTATPMLTMPTRALCPERGPKPSRYVPAVATNVSKTFEKFRRLQSIQERLQALRALFHFFLWSAITALSFFAAAVRAGAIV